MVVSPGAVACGCWGDNVVWFCPPVGSTAGAVALVCGADSIGLFSTVPQADSDTSIAKLIKQAKTFRFIPSLFSSVLTLAWLEMEEFMHGVYHSIDQDTYLLYLGCPGKHYQRMVNMMKYFGERDHAHNYMVTSEKEQESKENFVYPFQNDPYFASMEYVVPLQVIARKLSLDLGIDCNISSDPNFHKKMGRYTY